MTLPTRPIEDVVADLIGQTCENFDGACRLTEEGALEIADILLSQAREVEALQQRLEAVDGAK